MSSGWRDVRGWLKSRVAGIYAGRTQVQLAFSAGRKNSELSTEHACTRSEFARELTVNDGLMSRWQPVQIGQANPEVIFLPLRVPQKVRRRQDVQHVIQWHAERKGISLQGMQLDYLWTGRRGVEHCLFVAAVDQKRVNAFCEDLYPRYVKRIAPSIWYLYKAGAKKPGPHMVIDLDDESLAILIFDLDGNVLAARAEWRTPEESATAVVQEARRLANMVGEGAEPLSATCWCPAIEWREMEQELRSLFSGLRHIENVAPFYEQAGAFGKAHMVASV